MLLRKGWLDVLDRFFSFRKKHYHLTTQPSFLYSPTCAYVLGQIRDAQARRHVCQASACRPWRPSSDYGASTLHITLQRKDKKSQIKNLPSTVANTSTPKEI